MRHWHSSTPRRGFSLIEVIASLFLVGTLFVAILAAQRRSVHQVLFAETRLEAIAALDELLAGRADPSTPADQELSNQKMADQKLAGYNPFFWRTSQRSDPASESLGAVVLRIEVYCPNYEDGKTLAAVEMLAAGSSTVGESW